MQRITREIPQTCEILFAGDYHYGSIFCHEEGIDFLIDYVKSKRNRFLVSMGDWIEAITVDDKRFNPQNCTEAIPMEQANALVKKFIPIRGRMIVGLIGNHERKPRVWSVGDLAKHICSSLKIPYGTEEARIIFTNNGEPFFNAFIIHGNKLFKSNAKDWEQQQANKKAALKLYLQNMMGDCAVMVCGHAHWLAVVPPSQRLYLVDGEKGVKQHYLKGDITYGRYINPDQRWYGCSGSFYKRYIDGYQNYGTYSPNELGFLSLTVRRREIVELRRIII